ncbi:hypothetical protein QJS66_14990 [Kocuria rhizophila]|nr:hypothetical protein QJS66_14990 [Kocuria rhizophila]
MLVGHVTCTGRRCQHAATLAAPTARTTWTGGTGRDAVLTDFGFMELACTGSSGLDYNERARAVYRKSDTPRRTVGDAFPPWRMPVPPTEVIMAVLAGQWFTCPTGAHGPSACG